MGLYNFRPQFVSKIESGEKTHTIRAPRVHQDKPGDTMHLYTGLRRKGARLLGRFECVKVEIIRISEAGLSWIDDILLSRDERQALARRDGFADFREMMRFWDGRRPFEGFVFHWTRGGRGKGAA